MAEAIVRGYDIDSWWLISGVRDAAGDQPADQRVGTLNLLSELGTTLTMHRRLDSHRTPTVDGGASA